MGMERTVEFENETICYFLERKPVKNLNLRIRRDCTVYVSAHPRIPLKMVDRFVISKGSFIRSAQNDFRRWHSPPLSPGSMSAEKRSICLERQFP